MAALPGPLGVGNSHTNGPKAQSVSSNMNRSSNIASTRGQGGEAVVRVEGDLCVDHYAMDHQAPDCAATTATSYVPASVTNATRPGTGRTNSPGVGSQIMAPAGGAGGGPRSGPSARRNSGDPVLQSCRKCGHSWQDRPDRYKYTCFKCGCFWLVRANAKATPGQGRKQGTRGKVNDKLLAAGVLEDEQRAAGEADAIQELARVDEPELKPQVVMGEPPLSVSSSQPSADDADKARREASLWNLKVTMNGFEIRAMSSTRLMNPKLATLSLLGESLVSGSLGLTMLVLGVPRPVQIMYHVASFAFKAGLVASAVCGVTRLRRFGEVRPSPLAFEGPTVDMDMRSALTVGTAPRDSSYFSKATITLRYPAFSQWPDGMPKPTLWRPWFWFTGHSEQRDQTVDWRTCAELLHGTCCHDLRTALSRVDRNYQLYSHANAPVQWMLEQDDSNPLYGAWLVARLKVLADHHGTSWAKVCPV